MDRILIIMKKNNGHQGIICPFTGAFFHNMQTCLLVYTYNRSQVSVYRTIGPLVLYYYLKIPFVVAKICHDLVGFENTSGQFGCLIYSNSDLQSMHTM